MMNVTEEITETLQMQWAALDDPRITGACSFSIEIGMDLLPQAYPQETSTGGGSFGLLSNKVSCFRFFILSFCLHLLLVKLSHHVSFS